MKIKTKINLSFLTSFILVFSFAALFVIIYTTSILKQDIYAYLRSTNQSKAEHLRTFIQEQEKISVILAAASVYRDFLKEPKSSSQYSVVKEKIDKRLKRTLDADPQIYESFILDSDGIVVASSDLSQEGKNRFDDPYFTNAKNDIFFKDIYYSTIINKLTYSISSPVKDDDGTFLGVSVLRFLPEGLSPILKNENRLGNTQENYLINKDKFFITPSFFLGADVILKQKAETKNTSDCFNKDEIEYIKKNGYDGLDNLFGAQVVEAKDYRGVNNIATHAYIPETGWCLITKADRSDLLSFRTILVVTFMVIFIIATGIFLFIGFIISRKITKPLSILLTGVSKIKEGDLDYKVAIKNKDEIGEIAETFGLMVSNLKKGRFELQKYAAGLESMVAEKTKDLKSKIEDLSKTQEAVLNVAEDAEQEKEKTKREKEKIDAILQSIGDGVFVVDRENKITIINGVAAKLSGFSIEESLGRPYKEVLNFVSEESGKVNDKFIKDAFATGAVQEMANHTVLINKDGKKTPVADSAAPLKDEEGKIIGCVVVFRDVTRERDIDRAKTEFVSLASHQLRTPLTAIRWYSEILLGKGKHALLGSQKKSVRAIYKGNLRMIDLVNALLNVSRLEVGSFVIEPEPASLTEISDSVIEESKPEIKTRKIKFQKKYGRGIPKEMPLDIKLTRMIFQNLLSNAIKYTKEGGIVSLNIENNGKEIELTFKDNGIGITKTQQDKIFEKLFRADNARQTNVEGTGLGLYIIKGILDHCGGRIWFESKENEGTIFYVTLPIEGMKKKEGTKMLAE